MRSKTLTILIFILFFLGSHAGATARAEESPPTPRPLGSDLPAFRAIAPRQEMPDSRGDGAATREPTGALTLRQALGLALMRNPELRAFSWEVRAREAATLQAGLLHNPTIGADLQDLGVSASPDSVPQPQGTLQLSQIIELGGKRTKRRETAALSRNLAGWDYEAKRIEIFTQVTQAFADLLRGQQQQELTEETVRLAEETARVVSERVQAGKVSPIEEIRANVALASAGIERDRAGKELEAARKQLAATWGSAIPQFEKAEGILDAISPIPSLSQLAERLFQNPDLARWATEIAQRRAAVDLERSRGIPDLTLMGGFRRYESTGDNVFIVGLSLPLPLFNRNQGGIQEARDRLEKGEEERRAAEVRVATALSEAYRALLDRTHRGEPLLRRRFFPAPRRPSRR
ncbi:MAG: TolC family protein (plasmid) [Candidatus Manganitrophus sp.]|nr:MAG: TolC family protein [Candidatus Manganitrophus sp.]